MVFARTTETQLFKGEKVMIKYQNAIPTKHAKLIAWVENWAKICEPDQVYWCDGSQAEYDRLCDEMVASGLATRMNPAKKPNLAN